jgi:hypothetical protein
LNADGLGGPAAADEYGSAAGVVDGRVALWAGEEQASMNIGVVAAMSTQHKRFEY